MPLYRRKSMRRMRRRYKRKRSMLLGDHPRTKSHTKSYQENNTANLAKAFGRIHSVEVFDIPRAASLSSTNNLRLTDRVLIKGIRIQKYFQNASSINEVVVNVAVVTPKGAQPGENNWGDAGTNWNTGFFREYGEGIRETAFNQSASTPLSAFQVNSLPINTDRFIIHKRWTKRLEPSPSAVSGETRHSKEWQWIINKYLPINRVINYQDTQDHPHDGRTFVIYWFDKIQRDQGTAVSGTAVQHSSRIVTFFKDKALSP